MLTPLNETQLYEEYNKLSSFELSVHAQEITQDAVTKIIEFTNLLKATSTTSLLGDQNSYLQRKLRFEETLNSFEIIFQRLRILGSLIHRRKQEIDLKQQQQTAAAVPEETNDQSITILENNNLESLKKEQEELKLQLKEKNSYLKLAIDKVSDIIWQINSMQKLKQ